MKYGHGNMKKVLFCIATIFLVCCDIYTQEYLLTEIEDIAISFLNRKSQDASTRNSTIVTKQISNIEAIIRNNSDYMYIVNTENSAGWVIISNEKSYPTIIAHADSGSFVYDNEILPPALLCILEQHMDAIDSTRINIDSHTRSVSNTKLLRSENTEEDTPPVLLTQTCWKQYGNNGAYDEDGYYDCERVYNKFVPASHDISCGRAVTGCGPVAMAQLMKYWQWPDYAFIRDTIIGGVCHGDMNQRFYDWDNMPNEIDSTTPIYQADAIAGLLRDCGYAANTVFWDTTFFCDGCSSTHIDKINSALKNDFGFHTNKIHEYSGTDMEPILRQEIDAKRPVLCQAWQNKTDTTDKMRHSFIIDGYKTFSHNQEVITEFTINWGWGWSREDTDDTSYYSMNFNEYDGNRKFLTEIYPDCEQREEDVLLSDADNVLADEKRTYYSGNDVIVSSNNNSIVVNNGGHFTVKAANQVRLKNGFHAKSGSNVHITIHPLPCDNPIYAASNTSLQRIAPSIQDNTEPTDEGATSNSLENIESNMIQSTAIYTISGQLLQTIEGGQRDAAHLPNGMYILQHRMSDGSTRSEKIANNK